MHIARFQFFCQVCCIGICSSQYMVPDVFDYCCQLPDAMAPCHLLNEIALRICSIQFFPQSSRNDMVV